MRFTWMLLVPLMMGVTAPAHAQRKDPRITMEAARRAAMARVPRSRVIKEELDHEKGMPVYEFELMVPGRAGYDEVVVDGMTGNVTSIKHETPRHEKKEMKKQMKQPASH